jgi:rubrerythrin
MTGWVCPKCGSVYAPFIAECRVCNTTGTGVTVTYSGGTVITGDTGQICPGCHRHRVEVPLTGCPPGSHYGTY